MAVVYASIVEISIKCNGPRSFMRDAETQAALYQIGRRGIAGEATVTDCDGVSRKSLHQSGLAMDISIVDENGDTVWDESKYQIVAKFWKSIGGRWGGDFTPREIWHFDLIT